MKIRTEITDMLGIDLPIIGAPMFLVSYPDLVAAVSNAGGIGTFPALNYRTIPELKDGLQEIRSKTDKPIGVNIILYRKHNPDWHKQLQAALDAKVELIITSLGTPKSIIEEVRSANAKIFCDVTTLRQARVIVKSGGCDALIAVAQGAGGHAGAISPFSLIPYLKKELGLPIIAAGAINDGKQMAASLSLGAGAVYVGTRLIASHEAPSHQDYKDMIIRSNPEDIEYTDKVSGVPANWLKESLKKLEPDHDARTVDVTQEYKRWRDIYSAGHGVAQIKNLLPAAQIVTDMAKEYNQIVDNLPRPS